MSTKPPDVGSQALHQKVLSTNPLRQDNPASLLKHIFILKTRIGRGVEPCQLYTMTLCIGRWLCSGEWLAPGLFPWYEMMVNVANKLL